MPVDVDLAARTVGLFPAWLFLLLLLAWLVGLLLTARNRPVRWIELPESLLAVGSLVVACVLFFWRPLFTAAHVPRGGGDLNSFFFSLHAYSAERISSGALPLWNPTLHGGMPHLGNFQAALLYPPNLLAYVIARPFSYGALEWLVIAHYLIASLGMYLLIRALGAGRIGAVTGAIIFAYGGFFVAHLGHYSMISAAAWLPWLFWAIYRLVENRSWWSAAGLAVITFLLATGGHQQTLLFAMLGGGVWWIFLQAVAAGIRIPGVGRSKSESETSGFSRLWQRERVISLIQFVVGTGTGLLLAAPMILPSLQLAQHSVRSTLSFDQASEFSVQPVALLQLLLPTVFGSNPTDYWGAFSSGEIWGYVGATTLAVAVLGLVFRPSPHRVFLAALAIFSILYALGPAVPIHGWFYQFVPGFDLVRAPARSYLFLNLALAVLAGLSVSDFARQIGQTGLRWQQLLQRSVRYLIVVIAVLGFIIIPYFYTLILGVNDPPNRPVIAVENLWMLLIFTSLLVLVLWLARSAMLRGAALALALAAILVLDLFSATMPFNPTEEDLVASYREPEITAFLDEQWSPNAPFRVDVHHPGLLPNFGAIDGFHVATGVFDPMQPAAYTRLHDVLAEHPAHPAYDLLNIRYWILAPDTEAPVGFELVYESSTGTQIWERPTVLLRAWLVSRVHSVPDEEAFRHLRDEGFDPANQVLVDADIPDGDSGTTGDVAITGYEPEEITLLVEADGPGVVVFSEGFYPGWTARVDGESVDIHSANAGLRAIPVDADSREIVLRYEPVVVTVGFIAGGLGGLLLIGMLIGPIILGPMRLPKNVGSDGD